MAVHLRIAYPEYVEESLPGAIEIIIPLAVGADVDGRTENHVSPLNSKPAAKAVFSQLGKCACNDRTRILGGPQSPKETGHRFVGGMFLGESRTQKEYKRRSSFLRSTGCNLPGRF